MSSLSTHATSTAYYMHWDQDLTQFLKIITEVLQLSWSLIYSQMRGSNDLLTWTEYPEKTKNLHTENARARITFQFDSKKDWHQDDHII